MLENFIYAKQKSLFEEALNNDEVLDEAIVFIEDTKEIWNHGTYFDGKSVDLSNIESSIQDIINKANNLKEFLYNITELTYSELKALVDNSELIPGHNYAITDYTCIYRLPTSKAEMEIPCPDVKYIICTANTTNTLLEDVLYVRNDGYLKIIECKYTIDPLDVAWTRDLTTLQPKGAVYYMKDIKGNTCNYDFKHVKFRRWAVTDITPNTTPDDGATYPCSPYSVYTTTSAKPWNDGRMRIGSGQSNDADLINGIFSGKWMNSTPECKKFFESTDDSPVEFSDQYVLESVKPYLDTNHPRNKYLAWCPNMNSSSGFAPTSRGTGITSGHQAVVTTDPNDYIDLYTFDCNGEDASEMGPTTGRSTGRIHSVEITRWGMLLAGLPDTVFIITTSLTDVVPSSTLFLQNVKIEDAFNNTILLLPTTGYNFAQWIDVEIKDMQKNLLITQQVIKCRWYSLFKSNLLVGGFLNFNTLYNFLNSVLFGLYKTVELGGYVNDLLWYGVNLNYRTTTSGDSYISNNDGTYTYEVETEGNFYSNILAPMLYCKFAAHCNTNTFRAPYMKGVQTHGVIQHASFGELKWGIDLNYNSGLGMYYGNIRSGTVLDTFSFATNINSLGTATGSQIHDYIFKNTLAQLPDLINTHVIAYYGDSLKLANLSDEEKAMLASTLPTELIWHEGDKYWTVNYKRNAGFEELTYQELYNKVQNSQLVPGKQYAITDYKCVYIQPTSNEIMTIDSSDVKYIICTAVSNNILSDDVLYVRHDNYVRIVECLYTIYPDEVPFTTGLTNTTGVVYYMRDIHGNECNYDFKHVKFRRWAITDITPNTTPDNGTTYPCSPYRAYTQSGFKTWSDMSYKIGCGEQTDKDIIEGAFSGKWAHCSPECIKFFKKDKSYFSEDGIELEFSDNHVLKSIKPYKNSEFPSDKYLAWCPNMNSSSGFAPTSRGTGITSGHQAVVTTNQNDYMDRYTFDYNGLDASEFKYGSSFGRVVSGVTLGGYYGKNKNSVLSDTCFIISEKATLSGNSLNASISDVTLNYCRRNTFFLYSNYSSVPFLIKSCSFGPINNNLITGCFIYVNAEKSEILHNFIASELQNLCIEGTFSYNVIFGRVSNSSINNFDTNLFINSPYYCEFLYVENEETKTTSINGKKGSYTYNMHNRGNCHSNIFMPIQRSFIDSLFTSNTFRAPYIDGLTIHANNQLCSYGITRYGTEIGYHSGLGIKYGKLQGVKTSPNCLLSNHTVDLPMSTWKLQLPDMLSTTIDAYCGMPVYLSLLSDELKNILTGDECVSLVWASNKTCWEVSCKQDSVIGNGINKLVKMTQTEYDALTTKDDNTLYVITE